LQRIAVCYFFSALIFIKTNWKGRAIITAFLLAFYWVMMKLYPVPGYGPGVLSLEGNLCTYIDNLILKGHMYKPNFDPEGIFSTIPAIATTLSGALVGDWIHSKRSPLGKIAGLFVVGNFAILAGIIMDTWLPINKQLWTSSYTVFTSGMAMVCFAMCYYIIDIKGYKRWAVPFTAMGMNAISMFVGNGLMVIGLSLWKITGPNGTQLTPLTYAYRHFFVPIAGNLNGSLLYAIVMVLIWIGIAAILYRKRIFIKI
jgi:predicted acyltransferase